MDRYLQAREKKPKRLVLAGTPSKRTARTRNVPGPIEPNNRTVPSFRFSATHRDFPYDMCELSVKRSIAFLFILVLDLKLSRCGRTNGYCNEAGGLRIFYQYWWETFVIVDHSIHRISFYPSAAIGNFSLWTSSFSLQGKLIFLEKSLFYMVIHFRNPPLLPSFVSVPRTGNEQHGRRGYRRKERRRRRVVGRITATVVKAHVLLHRLPNDMDNQSF